MTTTRGRASVAPKVTNVLQISAETKIKSIKLTDDRIGSLEINLDENALYESMYEPMNTNIKGDFCIMDDLCYNAWEKILEMSDGDFSHMTEAFKTIRKFYQESKSK